MAADNDKTLIDDKGHASPFQCARTADLSQTKTAAGIPEAGDGDAEIGKSPFPKFGRFELVRPLGRGGMGQVFEVIDPDTNQKLALKTWRAEDPRLRASLTHEFLALSRLRHPNLVRFFELSLGDKLPFFTMELLSGQDLLTWVRSGSGVGPAGFDEERLRSALRQLVEGLIFLHENGYLHRDIKPSNVMITSEGTVKLLDFGVAAAMNQAGIYEPTNPGGTAGTERYMSPAQSAGESLKASDDWYSVGLVLFECLTGEFPFAGSGSVAMHLAKQRAIQGVSPQALQPSIPDDLALLCTELLRVDPARRPEGQEILRRLGASSTVASPATPSCFLGRTREIETLQQALASVLEHRQPRIVFVQGNSGIGKSELVSRFLDQAAAKSPVRVFRGRCYENVFAPYQAFQELLTDICRYLRRLPGPDRLAQLPTDVRSLRDVFPVFGDQDVLPTLPQPEVASTVQERRQQGFAALRELLQRIGPAGLVQGRLPILFIDDLQWADLDSLALLFELMRAPSPPPCLFVGSFRTEDAKTSPFLQALGDSTAKQWSTPPITVDVRPLTLEEAAALAGELLAAEAEATPAVAQLIARQSRGNPLFVSELVQFWRTSCDVSLSGDLNLDTVVQQRVAALRGELRLLVQLVAIAGRPVPSRELFRATELANQDQAWIQDLNDGHFLRSVGTAERIRLDTFHDRIREAVLSTLSPDQRRELCKRWVQVLLPPEPTLPNPEVSPADSTARPNSNSVCITEYEFIAQMLLGAGRPVDASHYLRLEAGQAAASFAFDRAAALYRLALANHGAVDEGARSMRIALAECLVNTGQSAQAAEEFLKAAENAPDDLSLDLRRRAAQRYLTSGHAPQGLAVLRQVFNKVGMHMPATPLGSLASLVWWRTRLWLRGLDFSPRDATSISQLQLQRLEACWSAVIGLSLLDPVRAADYVARNLWMSLELGNAAHIVRALAVYAGHAAINGPSDAKAVAKVLDASRRAAQFAPGEYGWGTVALAEAIANHLQGHWGAAITSCDKAEGLFRRCQHQDVTWELDTTHTFAMWALMFRGDIAEMTRRQPRLVNQAIERNDRYARLNFGTVVMTYVNLAAGKVGEARELLAEDESLLMADGYHVQHHNAALARAFLELYDGQPQAAWEVIKDGWRSHVRSLLARIQKVRIDFFQVYGRAAIGALAQDRQSSVLQRAAQNAIVKLRRERIPWAMGMADVVEAGKYRCEQRPRESAAALQSAAARLAESEMQLFALAAQRQLAQLNSTSEELHRIDESLRRMGVCDPERMAAALVPGCCD